MPKFTHLEYLEKWEGYYYLYTDGSFNDSATSYVVWDALKLYALKYKMDSVT